MKGLLILLFASIILINYSDDDLSVPNLNGKIKSIIETHYTIDSSGKEQKSQTKMYYFDKSGHYTEVVQMIKDSIINLKEIYENGKLVNVYRLGYSDELYLESIYKYDSKGNLMEHLKTYPDKRVAKTEYKYDDKGRRIETISNIPGGGSIKKMYEYDSKDYVILREEYKNEKLNWKEEYTNTYNGRKIEKVEIKYHDAEGKLYSNRVSIYDKMGNEIEFMYYYAGVFGTRVTRKYDDKNRLIEYCVYDESNNIIRKSNPVYDNYGNIIQTTFNEGQISEYQYEYDQKNNWISVLWKYNGKKSSNTIRQIEYY